MQGQDLEKEIREFQNKMNLPVTGTLDDKTQFIVVQMNILINGTDAQKEDAKERFIYNYGAVPAYRPDKQLLSDLMKESDRLEQEQGDAEEKAEAEAQRRSTLSPKQKIAEDMPKLSPAAKKVFAEEQGWQGRPDYPNERHKIIPEGEVADELNKLAFPEEKPYFIILPTRPPNQGSWYISTSKEALDEMRKVIGNEKQHKMSGSLKLSDTDVQLLNQTKELLGQAQQKLGTSEEKTNFLPQKQKPIELG